MISVQDKMVDGSYENPFKYPTKPQTPAILSKKVGELTTDEITQIKHSLETFQLAKQKYEKDKADYLAAEKSQIIQFQKDLEEEFGLSGHPKAQMLFDISWRTGDRSLPNTYVAYSEISRLLI